MKITIVQGAFLPVPAKLGGAVEKMWFALGKIFVQAGHQVVHISRRYPELPNEETVDGVLHKRIKGYDTPSSGIYLKWLDLQYTVRALRLVPKDSDIVITNTFWSPILINRKLKSRCYVDVQRMPKGQMKYYQQAGRLRANSTPVVAAIKQELKASFHNKVVMIPNPIPFIPDGSIPLNKQKIILYTGRLHPEKGLEILLSAYRMSNIEAAGWTLKIVGPWQIKAGGGGDAYFEKLKSLAGDIRSIEFIGPIYNADTLNEIYQSASIFTYPSIAEKGETFGIAPLEAMAWGCVPIVSALECFQDFIHQQQNGLIFNHRTSHPEVELAAFLNRLVDDITLTERLRANCLGVRNSHSAKNIATQFLSDFSLLINK